MKINPENFILDDKLCLNYKSFFICGNDEGYIFSILDVLVKNFSRNGFIKRNLNEKTNLSPDLFKDENKYVYVCDKYLGNNAFEEVECGEDIFIFYEKNSAKNKSNKHFFSKSKHRALIECYELDQGRKKNILNGFVKKHSLVFENNVYWFLLESLNDKYSILSNELDKILLLKNKNDISMLSSALDIEKLTEANKLFFKLNLNRSDLTTFLNSSVNSISDFYSCFVYFKIYSTLLFSSKDKNEFESKIPRYLFKEKKILISFFNSLNENKKKLLSSLIYKTENLVRKNPTLYKSLFFRFILNYKKIIS